MPEEEKPKEEELVPSESEEAEVPAEAPAEEKEPVPSESEGAEPEAKKPSKGKMILKRLFWRLVLPIIIIVIIGLIVYFVVGGEAFKEFLSL